MFVADVQTGIILDVNKRAEQLLGISAEKIIGMHQSQLHPQEDAEYYRNIFKLYNERGKGIIKDIFVCHKDGHTIPVEISSSVTELKGKRLFREYSEI